MVDGDSPGTDSQNRAVTASSKSFVDTERVNLFPTDRRISLYADSQISSTIFSVELELSLLTLNESIPK